MPHALLRVLASTSIVVTLTALPDGTARAAPVPAVAQAARVRPVPAIEEPPPASVELPSRPSPALREAKQGPVGPEPLRVTTPAGPELVNELTDQAADRQEAQGLGRRAPDPDALLPATQDAAPLTLLRPPAAVARTFAAPKPASALTYRLCVRSAAIPVACSQQRPLAVPVAADVTGDGVPDLAADLVPAASPGNGNVGLGLTVRRLTGERVKAMVWAEYDGKVSVGFDGLRNGATLSALDRAMFTVDLAGRTVRADVRREDPGPSAATLAALTGRTAVSLRQTPATGRLTVEASLDAPGLDVTASAPARLDALAVTRDRFTEAVLDRMPTRARVRLSGGRITLTGHAPIGRAEVHSHLYQGGRLARSIGAELRDVPRSFAAGYASTRSRQTLTVESARPARAGAARVLAYDRAAANTVLRAALSDLPARVRLVGDLAAHRVTQTAGAGIGGFAVTLQRGGGAIATPRGNHVTMIKNGNAAGISARMSGLSGFDVTYGGTPHARLETRPGNGSFVAAADVDGVHRARLEISNTPARVELTLDPAARKAVYRASAVIDQVRAAYAGSGLTVDGTVRGVRDDVRTAWTLGARTSVQVTGHVKEADLYAARDGDELRVRASGLRRRAELTTGDGTLTWTADAPVTQVSALVKARTGGRTLRASADVRGVPARFDATWNAGTYRFRGLSGPVGTAALAFTNHDGATSPTGPHLAAHYDRRSGDLDASVLVKGLSLVAFSPAGEGFEAAFRAARQRLAVDADVTLGDLRFGLLGRVGPVPGALKVAATPEGRLTYSGSRLDVTARAWLGRAAALGRMRAAPAVRDGLSLVDGGCADCGQGPFCTSQRGCFGLQGYLDVTGLPDQVTVDPAGRTFAFSGFAPRRRSLAVFLASSVLSPVPVKVRATLTRLPSRITRLSLGPFDAGRAAYQVEPAATLGTLDVRAEAGGLRGRVTVDPVPAAVDVRGVYGARTRVRVRDSAPVERLTARVTLPGRGTGEVRFTDVPAAFAVDADASAAALGVPAITYHGDSGTLDGRLRVDGGLADPSGRLGHVSLEVGNLAPDTTIRVNPDRSLDLVSKPVPTGLIAVHAGLRVGPVARQRVAVAKEVPYTKGFLTYHVGGDLALGASAVEDVALTARRVSWLRVRPGRIPFGLNAPPALGFLTPGFEGAYDRLRIAAKGVDLRPDVSLTARLSRSVGADVFTDALRLTRTSSLALRRYDQRLRRIGARQQIEAAGLGLACLTVDAKPGFAGGGTGNTITLRGSDGPQTVSFLDPGGQAPDYAVDLLTSFMSPFPGADWRVAGAKPGSCAPTGSPAR